MLKKISRKAFLKDYPEFIQENLKTNKYIFPEAFDSYILHVEAKSNIGLCNNVSKELTDLLKLLQFKNVSFLGDTTTPWLFREHDYKPVKAALKYLTANKISKSFNGAIQVNLETLPGFMKHLFWLVRCNGIVMYAHFSDPGFNIIGSICQYGNIHFSTLHEETDVAFNKALSETNLSVLSDNKCGGGRIYKRYATRIKD